MASQLVSDADMEDYRDLMYSAHLSFDKKDLIWCKQNSGLSRYGEDAENGFTQITLRVSINYNYMRSWPVTVGSESGKVDRESCQVLLNKQYLAENGFINTLGYFEYNADDDFFLLDGIRYRSYGDSAAAQAGGDDVFIFLILKREELQTWESKGHVSSVSPPTQGVQFVSEDDVSRIASESSDSFKSEG